MARNPDFKHVRRQALQISPKEASDVRWVFSDMNVEPEETLQVAEKLLTPMFGIAGSWVGGVLTLKLKSWTLTSKIPGYVARVRKMGFPHVRVAQLLHNRQEVCVTGLRRKSRST